MEAKRRDERGPSDGGSSDSVPSCLVESGVVESGVVESGVVESGVVESGVVESGVARARRPRWLGRATLGSAARGSPLSKAQFVRAFRPPRRRFATWVASAVLLTGLSGLSLLSGLAAAAEIVDLRGRTVDVPTPADAITIDDGRFLVALALLHADPGSVLAGWPRDVHRIGESVYAGLAAASPSLRSVPQVASSAGSFNLEALLAAAPDAAVVSLGSGPTDAQVRQLEGAGIPVVFIDFFTQPFENQARSLRILGQLTGREQQAEEFIEFRAQRMKTIAERVAGIPEDERPTVFLEAHAGMSDDCCNSPGRGNVGDYIEFVGGRNIGADVIQGSAGKLNLEYVISRDPDVYIATGGPHLEGSGGLVLGPGYDTERARETLAAVAGRQGIAELSAVETGNVHGLSHLLINSPIDIVAIEAFAKWIHPELFADLDPAETLAEINRRFLPVPYEGVHWIDLEKQKGRP